MADTDNKDEYTFDDSSNQQNSSTYTKKSFDGSTENYRSIFKNQRLMIFSGGIILLWLVSYIFESSSSDDSIVSKKDSSEISVAQQELTSDNKTQNSTVALPSSPQPVQTSSSTDSAVTTLQAQLDKDERLIEELTQKLTVVEAKQQELLNYKSQMYNKIQYLSTYSLQLNDKITKIEDKFKPKKKEAVKTTKKLVTYNIRALVQGRAWLVDSNNTSVTVVEGESLKDYGKIKQIYPAQGLITTTSGRVIQFMND